MVELLASQNNVYEEELRVQDTQERRFVGHNAGIEAELRVLFDEEDAAVKEIEEHSIRLRQIVKERDTVKAWVLEQKRDATTVDTGLYNIRAATQHVNILKHRLSVALDHVNHFIAGAGQSRMRLDELRSLRALADTKLSKTEQAVAIAEVDHASQRSAMKAARRELSAVHHEVRKVQERALAEKLEFDGAVAEFRKQFLANMHRMNGRMAKSGADKQAKAGKQKTGAADPLHVIGGFTLEEELEMTRLLRSLEDDEEALQREGRQLYRSIARARRLLAELQREFHVPEYISTSLTPTAAKQPHPAAVVAPSGEAVLPFGGGRPRPSDPTPAEPTTLGMRSSSSTGPAVQPGGRLKPSAPPRKPFSDSTGSARRVAPHRESILGGQAHVGRSIEEFIVEKFNDAEASHYALTKQITEREMDVRRAEIALAAARKACAEFAPGGEYDVRRQGCVRATKSRATLKLEAAQLDAKTLEVERATSRCNEVVARLGRRFSIDISTLANPLDRLTTVFMQIERLCHVTRLADVAARKRKADAAKQTGAILPLRGRFSSLVVSVDPTSTDPLAFPVPKKGWRDRLGSSADTRKLLPIQLETSTATSAFIADSARVGTRTIVLKPNVGKASRVAARLERPTRQGGARPMARAELERESVKALLQRPLASRPVSRGAVV